MRKYLVAILLALSLTGCAGSFPSLTVHDTATVNVKDPVAVARAAVDQAYATHASIATTLLQNYKDGIITKEEKDSYAARLKTALDAVDAADGYINSGNLSGTNAQLALANSAFTFLQQELARYAAKEKH